MTREQAIKELNDAAANDDQEVGHVRADSVLCDLLMTLGYADVVTAYEKVSKWYA